MLKVRRKSNATIRAFYNRQRLLKASGVPMSLKLQLLGVGKGGGYLSRMERLRRKLPKQPAMAGNVRRLKTRAY